MINKDDVIDIDIDDITVEGAGVGRHEGFTVFVPKALPGETVSVKIIKVTKSYAVARLLEIKEPSEHRIKSFCASFEACGGCTLQHLSYEQQLKYKQRYVQQCFKRIGGIDIEEPEILAAENTRDYRNKASFPVSTVDGKTEAGLYAPRSHRLIATDCPIQKPEINTVKNAIIKWANDKGVKAYDEEADKGILRHIISRQSSNGEVMAGVVVRERIDESSLVSVLKKVDGVKTIVVNRNSKKGNAILGDREDVILGDGYITENYDGLSFRAGLSSFLQINHPQSVELYKTAIEYADITRDDVVFDLFCGIGTLSLLAAKRAKKVIGIEYLKTAVDNAKENTKINGIDNAEFLAGDAGEMMPEGVKLAGKPDILILDPPRKGCDSGLIEKITAIIPERIVYVSCDPATLARDAALFLSSGYKLEKIKAVDMFPQTTHVECVIRLCRKD